MRARARLNDLLALLGGAIAPLAFAPFSYYALAVASPAVLFWTWRECSAKRAFWRGWLFGLGMFGLGVSWVSESFQYNQVPMAPAILLTTILVMFLSLFPACLGFLAIRLSRANCVLQVLCVLPSGWVLMEWLRASILNGFSWLQLGYSQIDSPLAGLAPITGIYAMNWAVVFTGALLVWCSADFLHRGWKIGLAVIALWGGAGFLDRIDWTEARGEPVRIALLQGNIPQEIKWAPEQRLPTVKLYLQLTRANWDADLVVWPETALPGLYRTFEPFLQRLETEAKTNHTDVLIGMPSANDSPPQFFNSLVSVGANRDFYHKRHLVPFGEYLPLASVLQPVVDLLGLPVSQFDAGGEDSRLLQLAGYPVGVSICYEATFGKDIIRALPQAAFLVNVSNDAWFGESIAPHQHLQMARMRAKETGRYLARGTNNGISAFIDTDGKIIQRSEQFVTTAIQSVVVPMSGITPYARTADWPTLALLGLSMVVGLALGAPRTELQ